MKILVAEDEPVGRGRIVSLLKKWGYDVLETDNGLAAWQALQSPEAPRLAVVDWMMPQMDGAQLCRIVRQRAPEPYVYILLLTAKNGPEDIITGLDAGADDYVTKPFDAHEFQMRLRAGARILALQDELITAREAHRRQAAHDIITGALNRRTVLEGLQREFSRAQRNGTSISIVLIDLDHFKSINDTYGHPIGDKVLQEAVALMQQELRPHDLLGRYGGEEFLVVIPDCTAAETAIVAERLRQRLAREPLRLSDGPIFLTASFGVASLTETSKNAETLIEQADALLYHAKRTGRNRVVSEDQQTLC